mmetsp:Transcript_12495/g.30693  ORF Transcript_12495/g.30693 Transcript_12495/m.30693 type:complete len:212 (-) Transcript_12495:872-1507(-)
MPGSTSTSRCSAAGLKENLRSCTLGIFCPRACRTAGRPASVPTTCVAAAARERSASGSPSSSSIMFSMNSVCSISIVSAAHSTRSTVACRAARWAAPAPDTSTRISAACSEGSCTAAACSGVMRCTARSCMRAMTSGCPLWRTTSSGLHELQWNLVRCGQWSSTAALASACRSQNLSTSSVSPGPHARTQPGSARITTGIQGRSEKSVSLL